MKAKVSRYWAVTRWFLGHDFFISYARADGQAHAESLANALSREGYTRCIDTDNSRPGALPLHVLLNLKRASVLVVLASPAACSSEEVAKEIAAFPCGPDQNIVLIRLCEQGTYDRAVWTRQVSGLPRAVDGTSWKNGEPSPDLESRLASSVTYLQESVRQKRTFYGGLSVLAVMVAFAAVTGIVAWTQIQRAVQAEARGELASAAASKAEQRERAANVQVREAEKNAGDARQREQTANATASTAQQRASEALKSQDDAQRAERRAKEQAQAAREAATELTQRTQSMRLASQVAEVLTRSQAEGLDIARRSLAHSDNPAARRAALAALVKPRVQVMRVLETTQFESIAWSDHDALVASTTDGGLILLNGTTLETRAVLPSRCRAPNGPLRKLTFSSEPKTRVAAVSRDAHVTVWDWGGGWCKRLDPGAGGHVSQLAWNADGNLLAAADYDGYVRVWRPTNGHLIGRCEHRQEVQGVLFDGEKIVSATKDSVARWALDSRGGCSQFERVDPAADDSSQPRRRGAFKLRASSLGAWFIATTDGVVERHPQRFERRGGSELEVCTTTGPDRYVTWGRGDSSALAVDLRRQNAADHPLPELRGALESVSLSCWADTAALASDSEVVWASLSNGTKISAAAINTKALAISPQRARPGGRAFDSPAVVVVDGHGALTRWSPFGFQADALDIRQVVHVGERGEVLSFEIENRKRLFNLVEVDHSSRSLDRAVFAWSSAGKLFAVGPQRGWSPVSQPREVPRTSIGQIEDVRVSTTGRVVAIKTASGFEVVSAASGGNLVAHPRHRSIQTFAVSDDGSLFVVERDGQILRIANASTIRLGKAPAQALSGEALIIGGTLHLVASDRIWTLASELKRPGRFNSAHEDAGPSVIDPSGRFYLDFERESVAVRDLQDGSVVSRYSSGCAPIASAIFSPNGHFLLVAAAADIVSCAAGGFSLVDAQDGSELFHGGVHANNVLTDSTGQWVALRVDFGSERLCIEGLHRDRAVVLDTLRARSDAIESARSLTFSETTCGAGGPPSSP